MTARRDDSRRGAGELARRAPGIGIAAVASLAVLAAGCSRVDTGFPNPPAFGTVSQPVLISGDGKTITSFGLVECGRHPRLVPRSFPGKVTLTWFNPDTSCNAEPLGLALAHTVLRAPLGDRALVQADTGTAIPYFSERDLAPVTVLPHGYRLTSDLPTDYSEMVIAEPGDTRTYAAAGGKLSVTQIVPEKGPFPLSQWPWPGRLLVAGRPAALLIDRFHGRVDARSITWAAHGYRFIVTIAAPGQHHVPLSTAELAAIATGIVLKPSQYR